MGQIMSYGSWSTIVAMQNENHPGIKRTFTVDFYYAMTHIINYFILLYYDRNVFYINDTDEEYE